ncbi:MAG TPA: hypothetical protein VGQ03_05145 [Nitrososphaera sp.]|nr:hypothetical protein [Nitrososphaera sp.]
MNSAGIAVLLVATLLLGISITNARNVYAHTFSGDQTAKFLATVEVIKVHLMLAEIDFATNATLSAEHAEHAAEHLTDDIVKEITERNNRLGTELPASLEELHEALESGNATAAGVNEQVAEINDLLGETVTVRIERTQLTNSTVQGTMLADLVDEILESYSGAYGAEEGHEEDDSMNLTETSGNESTQTSSMEGMASSEENHTTLVNIIDYESAQALAARAVELFDTKLKVLADANATDAVTALEAGLQKLKQAIDNKATLDDVEVIVHTDVHQNIQEAYDLQVIPEFPLPLLMAMSAIVGIVAVTRLRMLSTKR